MKIESSIPEPYSPAWWERHSAQFEIGWMLTPGGLTLRRWAFHPEGALVRQYKGHRVFWLRGFIRLLGLSVGAGIFLLGRKLPEA